MGCILALGCYYFYQYSYSSHSIITLKMTEQQKQDVREWYDFYFHSGFDSCPIKKAEYLNDEELNEWHNTLCCSAWIAKKHYNLMIEELFYPVLYFKLWLTRRINIKLYSRFVKIYPKYDK